VPTLNDLFAPVASGGIGYFDLLTNFAGTGTQQVTQGNADLVPEVAQTRHQQSGVLTDHQSNQLVLPHQLVYAIDCP
jgi:hypothetical protein